MEQLGVLSGRSITAVWKLAAVSEDGVIPLLGELVIETGGEYVLLSYQQDGLVIAPPTPRQRLRWRTEPWLSMTQDGAEEWLDLTVLDDDAVLPPLPLTVRAVETWRVRGDYLADMAISLSDGQAELVITTTIDFDLVCVTRAAALEYLESVATNLSMPTHHTSTSAG